MKDLISNEIRNQALEALKAMISQPSFNQEAEENAPFGKDIRLALDKMMEICKKLGFTTYEDPEGYYGYAEIGEGSEIFGIIGHLDTVPAENVSEWERNPYKGIVENDVIYGRGAQDDKGPTIAALFAVKALMDDGFKFNRKIRFIFGTDEEILWRGIAKYNEKESPITLGFSPDAEFPVTYAEKGLQQAYLIGPGTNQLFVDDKGAFNAVPAQAFYNGPKLAEVKDALDQLGFEYKNQDDGILVLGKTMHAMLAPQGTNAVLRLGMALDEVFDFKPLDFIGKLVKEDATGTNVLGKVSDETGDLTFNISSLEINEKETRMQLDMRIPSTIDHDKLIEKLSKIVEKYDLHYKHFDYLAPLHVSADSTLVQTLMDVYRTETGDKDAQPQISGGATFARTMNNCVAFGAMLPTTPDYMHQMNEQWSVADFNKAMDIYAQAVKRLCVD
ncbi:M20 family metallopeptidase [Ligilactobacillus sp. LYQ135]